MKTPAATTPVETLVAEHPALASWLREAAVRVATAEGKTRVLEADRARDRELIVHLELLVAELKRLVFGMKSERFVPDITDEQLALFAGEPVAVAPPPEERVVTSTVREKKQKPVRQVLPASYPRKIIVIEPEGDLTGLRRIGEEITETLDITPARILVIRRVRPKYIDPRDESRGVIVAPLPARPVDKGIAEPGLLAAVVIDKFVDHLPVYRQVERFRREGLVLAESTLGDWISSTAELLGPLYEALVKEARASGYLQADETPLPVLREKAKDGEGKKPKKGQPAKPPKGTHQGWVWLYHAVEPGLVVMEYQATRGRDGPKAWLEGYKGLLQTDGYNAYDEIDPHKTMIRAGCWAHARRHFYKALGSAPAKAEQAMKEIKSLYEIEETLRQDGATPAERARVRREKAKPVLDSFKAWLEANPSLPKTPFGKAASYTLTRWDLLTRYVDEGRLEIDNNLIENQVRPLAIGRKNYLFAGSDAAAKRAAVIYSLLGTCKRHGINPWAWLSDVLARIPTHPASRTHDLLPHRWQAPAVDADADAEIPGVTG